ncbi:MAG: M23 family metallopeptidase, partial [Nocardioides sp.]
GLLQQQELTMATPGTHLAEPDLQPGAQPSPRRGPGPRWMILTLAAIVFGAALLVVGPGGLIPFGLLLVLSTDPNDDRPRRSVVLTRRNVGVAAAMVAGFIWFWLWQLVLTESTLVLIGAALIALPLALQDSGDRGAADRTIAVTQRSLILAIWGLLVFVYLFYAYGQSLNMLAGVCLVLPLALAASRVWGARQGRLELGLLRRPFSREVRPHLVQTLNIWLCCALLGGVLAAGGTHYARIWLSLNQTQFDVVIAAFATGLVLLAALAVVPRRRVYVATNVVVALLSGFLAFQLAQVSDSSADAVVLDSPLAGEWFVLNGGRSVLLNGHSANESNAVDFLRLGGNGRTHTGGSGAPLTDYAGFGWTVSAPLDGRVVKVTDGYADNPPGTNSDQANHLVIDIGDGRYVSMAHLQQNSVIVDVGDLVQQGQPIAAVGNNGHSNEPHLHLQVQDTAASTDAHRTYPMVFHNVEINRAGVWPWGDSHEPRTGDLVRRLGQ